MLHIYFAFTYCIKLAVLKIMLMFKKMFALFKCFIS